MIRLGQFITFIGASIFIISIILAVIVKFALNYNNEIALMIFFIASGIGIILIGIAVIIDINMEGKEQKIREIWNKL